MCGWRFSARRRRREVMGKPWSRLEIGYLGHPKFLALNANAICLWHEAKDFCDQQMTDGFLPRDAMKRFRFSSLKTIELLLRSCGPKHDGTPYTPLLEPCQGGYRMHDYLEHNPSRDDRAAAAVKADDWRRKERERKAEWRASREISHGTNLGRPKIVERETEVETVQELRTAAAPLVSFPQAVEKPDEPIQESHPPPVKPAVAKEPNGDNYRPILAVCYDVLRSGGVRDQIALEHAVKAECQRLGIVLHLRDHGKATALERACSSAWAANALNLVKRTAT